MIVPRARVWKIAGLSAALLFVYAVGAGSLSRGSEPTPDVDTVAAVERASDRIPAPLGRTERITPAPAVIVRSQSFEEQRIAVEVVEVVEVAEAPRTETSTSAATTTSTTAPPIEAVPGVVGLPVDVALVVLAEFDVIVTLRISDDPGDWGLVLAQRDGNLIVGSE